MLGGARSGKSDFAATLAAQLGRQVLFVATAWPSDEAMAARIAAHRASRPAHWRTVEARGSVAAVLRAEGPGADVCLVDCLTLLVSGLLSGEGPGAGDEEAVRREIEDLADCMSHAPCDLIVVSNEVGMGVVPPTAVGQEFADLLGWANRQLAAAASDVYLMVAGIPVTVKPVSSVRSEMDLAQMIRDVPDFPQPGIVFKDITPLLADPQALQQVVEELAARYKGLRPDLVAAVESRGFIFGAPLAYRLGAGLVPVRKGGRLPWESIGAEYSLEYGTARLEVHTDAIAPGQRVLVVDDLLATGGTARATAQLVEQLGGKVLGFAFLVELGFLNGRAKLADYEVSSLIRF
ncbi:MAG: adenine phosphoribosyltransferase [Chloroflexi bacterium]|nr:adenine phosphoribosyltransferase [Chloroflexota bacterium]